ncbi:tetratricopeptide repeat protein [Parendozoicomonas haliclonae]|uniref:Tetratricopeptide repeat protein n=1 Tax=Parendozoicomonas haliclonae TaxID=1960125 RepID=A0A1X7AHX3_9GAMM|nr:hypothetical protein [Parendozoicomonas haliclonae]SMA43744.1 hypothetical protein EHSB41UT_01655 [Parendozoicomonas haliclonae]
MTSLFRSSLFRVLTATLVLIGSLASANTTPEQWNSYPAELPKFDYSGDKLKANWDLLTRGTKEPFPDVAYIKSMAEQYPEAMDLSIKELRENSKAMGIDYVISDTLTEQDYQFYAELIQQTWRFLFEGRFQDARELGMRLGPMGYIPGLYAQSIYAQHLSNTQEEKHTMLREVIDTTDRMEKYVPDYPFILFGNAYAKARIAEDLSMAKALATGYTKPMKKSLEKLISLYPSHMYGYASLGGLHGGIVEKSGSKFLARMTYGATVDDMEKYFGVALDAKPALPVTRLEYAIALHRVFGDKKKEEALAYLREAVAMTPVHAEESLDIAKANRLLKEWQ